MLLMIFPYNCIFLEASHSLVAPHHLDTGPRYLSNNIIIDFHKILQLVN